jgi:hypothetical protein
VRGEYPSQVPAPLSPDWNDLQEIITRLSALTSEPRSENLGQELAAIRDHLSRLAADNAEVGRCLRVTMGLEPDASLPEQ